MKKTVKFEAFGKESDYIMLDLNKLARMEQITGIATAELFDLLKDGRFGVLRLMQTLPIALSDCRTIDDIEGEMTRSIENGYSIMAMSAPLLSGIIAAGIFGDVGKLKANRAEKK